MITIFVDFLTLFEIGKFLDRLLSYFSASLLIHADERALNDVRKFNKTSSLICLCALFQALFLRIRRANKRKVNVSFGSACITLLIRHRPDKLFASMVRNIFSKSGVKKLCRLTIVRELTSSLIMLQELVRSTRMHI